MKLVTSIVVTIGLSIFGTIAVEFSTSPVTKSDSAFLTSFLTDPVLVSGRVAAFLKLELTRDNNDTVLISWHEKIQTSESKNKNPLSSDRTNWPQFRGPNGSETTDTTNVFNAHLP